MLYYLKKYPISLTIIAVVIYLSFFKPPSLEVGKIVGIDKVAHLCMYAGLSGMLWIEFLRNHRKYDDVLWHAWIGAVLCPVLMSGAIELLQEYCTTYRGGDYHHNERKGHFQCPGARASGSRNLPRFRGPYEIRYGTEAFPGGQRDLQGLLYR